MVTIEIDPNSGFCFGVVNAIRKAEKQMINTGPLYCLGDIVHNTEEVKRLENKGLITIAHKELDQLQGKQVLFRAHGEPPSVYRALEEKGITIVDATCPVVLRLQHSIRQCYEKHKDQGWQIVIFGQRAHAEVNGLVGQTDGRAIVIESLEEAENALDFKRPIELFSQTTKSLDTYRKLIALILERKAVDTEFIYHDTVCRQVSMRNKKIRDFAKNHDRIFFIAGKKSSNGKVLFSECLRQNPKSFFISNEEELTLDMLPESMDSDEKIGICGATSTPFWQMEGLQKKIFSLLEKKVM